jgi:hypothetical protein
VFGFSLKVVGKRAAIFDTGTTLIIGDPFSIVQFYAPLYFYGAFYAGGGLYTSTWVRIGADQKLHRI